MKSVCWGLVFMGLMIAPAKAQPNREAVLRACTIGQADQLPNPFSDISEKDWAYKAVLTLYYCGAYRGAIPAEQYQRYLDSRQS